MKKPQRGDSPFRRLPQGLALLYEDQYLLVVDKPAGLLSIAAGSEREKTAYWILAEYLRRKGEKRRPAAVHRLDRDTSGLMIFAKSPQMKKQFMEHWNDLIIERRYIALAEGSPGKETHRVKRCRLADTAGRSPDKLPRKLRNSEPDHFFCRAASLPLVKWSGEAGGGNTETEGIIDAPLGEDSSGRVVVRQDGKPALTRWKLLKFKPAGKNGTVYSLLSLELETGRRNQIRAHLAHLGCPVAGDRKYFAKTNPLGRLCLHANRLVFKHPQDKGLLEFESPISFLTSS
jgi:23S rRNA pseudouridine1911/1915/1917 synthase